jgi:hypothetical protein
MLIGTLHDEYEDKYIKQRRCYLAGPEQAQGEL